MCRSYPRVHHRKESAKPCPDPCVRVHPSYSIIQYNPDTATSTGTPPQLHTPNTTYRQVLGMVLSDLKGIAEKNLDSAVVDCCIGTAGFPSPPQNHLLPFASSIPAGDLAFRLCPGVVALAVDTRPSDGSPFAHSSQVSSPWFLASASPG
ncbi:putative pollen-specific leucine-rich repeat extensin-like protein 3 [Iris pallida]|uniref:Pollen-specific leucine-rich repeat extensin-like protein 3 n=1 Tax=Iris pallida TaxID=29817 RepID=A0AAX6HTM6_IRIPA|nr:putative pollen-specific leucine-rich repeat extensin-like protein 3 [Iris pallida]